MELSPTCLLGNKAQPKRIMVLKQMLQGLSDERVVRARGNFEQYCLIEVVRFVRLRFKKPLLNRSERYISSYEALLSRDQFSQAFRRSRQFSDGLIFEQLFR